MEGEAGSGKETLSRYLHRRSSAASAPFERHDAREWLASEAHQDAFQGFLYLDRVDLLESSGQSILLRLFKALHARTPGRAVIVVSSHSPLHQLVAQGLFMSDLAFRLTALRFVVPPLRQRLEDVAPLAHSLLDRLCSRYQQRPVALSPAALARLTQHTWPGNLRELASVLEASLLEAANGVIRAEDLPIHPLPMPPVVAERPDPQPAPRAQNLALDAVVRRHVRYVLDLNRGNKLRAARQLGISRSTLYRILANGSPLIR